MPGRRGFEVQTLSNDTHPVKAFSPGRSTKYEVEEHSGVHVIFTCQDKLRVAVSVLTFLAEEQGVVVRCIDVEFAFREGYKHGVRNVVPYHPLCSGGSVQSEQIRE